MNVTDLIKRLAMGAFVGCFIVMFIMVLISLTEPNVAFSGTDVINAFLGSIVAGWAFSLSGMIYDRDDIALPLQVIFQMGIGMAVLFTIAIYLHWMPTDLGYGPVITWIVMAFIFGAVFWCGFYIYYSLQAREINKMISEKNV